MLEPKPWNPESGITLYEDRKLWIDYARELKEHNEGMEKMIDHLMETSTEARSLIGAYALKVLSTQPKG